MKLKNAPFKKNERRLGALQRLKENSNNTELNEDKKLKMYEEIYTLEKRIVTPQAAKASKNKIYRGAK